MKLKLTIDSLIELIWPRTCIVCKRPKHDLCPSCRLKIINVPQFCPLCFKRSHLGFVCSSCQKQKRDFYFSAIYVYSNSEQRMVDHCLGALREKGQKNIGNIIGKMMGLRIIRQWPKKSKLPKILIPWPIAKLAERQRGYNQNLYLAQGFNIDDKFIIEQKSLRFKKRKKQPFSWKGLALNQENVLLISDYLPSDSLIDLAAQVIKDAGAKKIILIAFSRKL